MTVTVIAARPGLMVSDSLISGDGPVATHTVGSKIYRMPGGYLAGFAGDVGVWQRLALCGDWPKRPSIPALVAFVNQYAALCCGDDGVDFIVATASEVFEVDGGSVSAVPVGVVGCGEHVARGYLFAKPRDIRGAVRAAIALAVGCGGDVRVAALPRAGGRPPGRVLS